MARLRGQLQRGRAQLSADKCSAGPHWRIVEAAGLGKKAEKPLILSGKFIAFFSAHCAGGKSAAEGISPRMKLSYSDCCHGTVA
jgi:hypothetical protein